MSTAALSETNLRQFTGTEQWYRHGLVRDILFTDGAKYVADEGKAYWLLDLIAISQLEKIEGKTVGGEAFQAWKLVVNEDQTALLTCDDGNGNIIFRKSIEYTDFPTDSVTLWCVDKTILLPSEY